MDNASSALIDVLINFPTYPFCEFLFSRDGEPPGEEYAEFLEQILSLHIAGVCSLPHFNSFNS